MGPFEFPDTLQLLQFIMIHHHIQYCRRLKQVSFTTSFFCGNPYAIYQIRLYSEFLSKNGDNDTCLAIFDCTKYNAFCIVQLIGHNYLLMKTILAAVFSVRSSLLTRTK